MRRLERDDLRRETYVRAYESAGASGLHSARSIHFTIAHYLRIDCVRDKRTFDQDLRDAVG